MKYASMLVMLIEVWNYLQIFLYYCTFLDLVSASLLFVLEVEWRIAKELIRF